jgi:alcohol dehydrogenase class IV
VRFEFAAAGRIVFGSGAAAAQLPSIAAGFGRRAFVVVGSDSGRATALLDRLAAEGLTTVVFATPGEPTVPLVRTGTARLRSESCDVVIAIGGGSAIDAGKAIAALATNSGEPLDYIEVVGRGQTLGTPSLPFIAVPTTSGTGSEVTRNAVLGSPEHGVKASLRSVLMLPRVAIVDPELTRDLPAAITASTGLDAITQLIEPFVSLRANAMVDGLCREGLARAAAALPRAVRNGHDLDAREAMAFASLLGGMALANAGLGVVHGFAAPIGGALEAPHGAVCAALLSHGMAANIRALRSRAPAHPALARYVEIARIVTGRPDAAAEDGVAWADALRQEVGIPRLGTWGVTAAHVPALVEKAAQASSMKANPIALTIEELTAVLNAAL